MMRAHVHPPGWRWDLNPLPERFRLSELAGRKARISGTVEASALERFSALCECLEAVRVRLDFRFDQRGELWMDGELVARVAVECQRCLEPVCVDLASDFAVAIVGSEAEATRLGAEQDVLRIDGDEAGIAELIEDELILALPEQPCLAAHCPRTPPLASPAGDSGEEALAADKPFAALGAWKARNT